MLIGSLIREHVGSKIHQHMAKKFIDIRTYVDDIARGTIAALKPLGFEVINLGNNNPDKLSTAIELIENYTGKKSEKVYKEFHKADIFATWADVDKANQLLGWQPNVNLAEGLRRSVEWAKDNWDWVKDIQL